MVWHPLAGLAPLGLTAAVVATPPLFTNQTTASGLVATHATSGFTNSQYAGGGAIGDFNRDGWMDVFFMSGGDSNAPDKLFINNGNGTFTDRAALWGLTVVHRGKSACVGDFDNDGWPDLYVTSAGPVGAAAPGHHKLYRNLGNSTFANVATAAGVAYADTTAESAWSACFGDYDLDGDLDLFVGGFTGSASNTEQHLFRNNGNSTFTDVTAAIELMTGVGPIALQSARFADLDGDRYPELLLVGDFKNSGGYIGSRYLRNNGDGTFSDISSSTGTCIEENGMGQAIGDFNNDLRMDWYPTSIYAPQIGWTGNKFYLNQGAHFFVEAAAFAGINDGAYGWGAVGVDTNHDGWEDILETNGDATNGSSFYNNPSHLWVNNGNNTFTDMSTASGFIFSIKGRALLRMDADNDGDQDVVICRNTGAMAYFRNDLPVAADTHWLHVVLDANGVPGFTPHGLGAKITVHTAAGSRIRLMDGGVSFLGTSEYSAHFGMGTATTAQEVRVLWPNGQQSVLTNVATNQRLVITPPPQTCSADINCSGSVDGADLAIMLSQWGGPGTADLNGSGTVDGTDLAQLLSSWSA